MMLTMLVSLFASAQYPTTKKIKGQQVVIMTVSQAEEIDNNFTTLNDSISILNSQLKNKIHEVKVVDFKKSKVDDSLQIFKSNLSLANFTIDSLKNETKRIEKLEYVEKRTRVRIGLGLGSLALVWGSFILLILRN